MWRRCAGPRIRSDSLTVLVVMVGVNFVVVIIQVRAGGGDCGSMRLSKVHGMPSCLLAADFIGHLYLARIIGLDRL